MLTVVLLRQRGAWRSRSAVLGPPHFTGELIFKWADPQLWGRTKQARLVPPGRPATDLVPPLHYARIFEAREGGQFIAGKEIFHRGAKSKPVPFPQLWWCMFDLEQAKTALARMDAPTKTGFHVNDDDWPY
ncbi:hypothetical protein SAMN05518854_117100 [Variovorax sp. YR266]|uniref:hypothetical protein n=1 Tax=Variovorax sp. YR266 TaxID=1884386 RepID=UPI0008970AFB|nr:hypothetical protein [Variovorax sp. YR266]SDZ71350.1 hypothetical protein SAMN05518854_117100 [Variovorax sp. YR266]